MKNKLFRRCGRTFKPLGKPCKN